MGWQQGQTTGVPKPPLSRPCEDPPRQALTVGLGLHTERTARAARTSYTTCGAQCKMKTWGPLFNVTENFETVTAEPETECEALCDCTACACAREASTEASQAPAIEGAAEVPG